MEFNKNQEYAIDSIYRIARVYTKIAYKLEAMADKIRLSEDDNHSEPYECLLVMTEAEYVRRELQFFVGLSEITDDALDNLIKEFIKIKKEAP